MRISAILVIALAATTCTAIAGDEWKSFRFAELGFAIDFPEAPISGNNGLDPGTIVRSREYHMGKNSYSFIVSATLFQNDAIEHIGGDATLLRWLIDAFTADCDGHSERTVLVHGAVAYEVLAESCQKGPAAFIRYYLVDDWLYEVLIVGPSGLEKAAEAKHFMESFKIIGK